MKESKTDIIITEYDENGLLDSWLENYAEKEFMNDDEWEIGEPRIFTINKKITGKEAIVEKYEVRVKFDPYFGITRTEIPA